MLDSDWMIAKLLKASWLVWMIVILARLKNIFILIFFHVKNNWLWNSNNCLFLIFFAFEAFQLFFSESLGRSKSPIFSFLFLLRCRHWIDTKELHHLDVAENTYVKMRQDVVNTVAFQSVPVVTFIHIAARNSLIISKRSIILINIMLNHELCSLRTHSNGS